MPLGPLLKDNVDNYAQIDFYADLIPLLKNKYAVGQAGNPVEANPLAKTTLQNLLVEKTQSAQENAKVSPSSLDHKSN